VQARDSAAEYVLPRNDLEKAIAAIWREVLHVDTVSIHDNFFTIGGHSLLLARVHSRLKAHLSPDLSIIELFRYPTIHALAKHLSNQQLPAFSFARTVDRAAMRARMTEARLIDTVEKQAVPQ
jgi:hypothetical protein